MLETLDILATLEDNDFERADNEQAVLPPRP